MTALPKSASAVHHHGPQDTIVYAASGHGAIVSEGGKKRQDLAPGDFALIPAYAEHQEGNDGDEGVEEEGLEEEEKLWKFTSRKGSWALLSVGPRGGKA